MATAPPPKEVSCEPMSDSKQQSSFFYTLFEEQTVSSSLRVIESEDDLIGLEDSADMSWSKKTTLKFLLRKAIVAASKTWTAKSGISVFDTVWPIFRELSVPVFEQRAVAKMSWYARREHERRLERKEAARKRAVKEREQYLLLGHGDVELGRQRFIARMHKEKEAKANKPVVANLALEREFDAWLGTAEAKTYQTPMKDGALVTLRTLLPHSVVRVPKIYCDPSLVKGLLAKLASHHDARDISVSITMAWDATLDPYDIPKSHNILESGAALALTNHTRHASPKTFRVLGFCNNYIVSDDVLSVYRLLPKKFNMFESRMTKQLSMMRVAYSLCSKVLWLEVCGTNTAVQVVVRSDEKQSVEDVLAGIEDAVLKTSAQVATAKRIAVLEAEAKRVAAAARAKGALGKGSGSGSGSGSEAKETSSLMHQLSKLHTSGHLSDAAFQAEMKKLVAE